MIFFFFSDIARILLKGALEFPRKGFGCDGRRHAVVSCSVFHNIADKVCLSYLLDSAEREV